METTILAALAFFGGGAAFWFWSQLGKAQADLQAASARAKDADSEASKQAERAESFRKKLETARGETAKEDGSADKHRQRAAAAKEEQKKLASQVKRLEDEVHSLGLKLRKAEVHAEGLEGVLHERATRKPSVTMPAAVAVVAAPEPERPPPAEDPKWAVRRAEAEAEKLTRQAEIEKLRTERDAMYAQKRDQKTEEFIGKLKDERGRLSKMVLEREMELRTAWRLAEDNRRAWIMTMGALDLAEDELYRIKHGRERPEFDPNRAENLARPHGVEVRGPDAGDEVRGPDAGDEVRRDDVAEDLPAAVEAMETPDLASAEPAAALSS